MFGLCCILEEPTQLFKKVESFVLNNMDEEDHDESSSEFADERSIGSMSNNLSSSSSSFKKTKEEEYKPFELPITYLDKSKIFELSSVVSKDLELSNDPTTTQCEKKSTMYHHILEPTHIFGENLMKEWNKQFTNDTEFLKESQYVIQSMSEFKNKECSTTTQCEKISQLLVDTTRNSSFLEKNSFVEWSFLEHLNNSSSFLQVMSLVNIMSPLMSLLLPLILIMLPFVLLKIKGIPIMFDNYLEVLKNIAKNHFIGKMILNCENISLQKIVYVFVMMGLYLLQIYQNVNSCFHFYTNIQKINGSLMELKKWLCYSIENMDAFIQLHTSKTTYVDFCNTTAIHVSHLKKLQEELVLVDEFKIDIYKISQMGYMLSKYYKLFSVKDFENAIRYSVGFEGFLNNLHGIYKNIQRQTIHFADFSETEEVDIKNQYYPSYKDKAYIVNDCSFDKNILISGPNASGKTTLLKTTCINIIFSQQFGCGFYEKCVINPYTHIHSYLNIPDTSDRDSLFQAESRRCKEIIDIIDNTILSKNRHFCIFDELFSGTNPLEATKTGYSFLVYLLKHKNVNFILTTHYTKICKKLKNHEKIQNYKMNTTFDENNNIRYLYKLKKGISKIQGAFEILKEMDFPSEILQNVLHFKK